MASRRYVITTRGQVSPKQKCGHSENLQECGPTLLGDKHGDVTECWDSGIHELCGTAVLMMDAGLAVPKQQAWQ